MDAESNDTMGAAPGMPEPAATEGAAGGNIERLMISKIEMVNFKSYYGRKVVGPFHKCFSSVVGPNGSGKSNVIDSMLFVFGYRASKIRQGKLSGLIHNSESHQNLDHCSVSVFFQMIVDKAGTDDFEVIPNSEVVVTRTANRDNTSNYTYNGKKMPFKELGQKLRKLGIDLDHNRFLILQGEVEAISMMPPKGKYNEKGDMTDEGMLEYLEDIIGSNQFIEPIKEMEAKVEQLNEDRALKLSNVKMVEKEKDTLEGGKTEAEAYLVQENEITVKRNELWQKYRSECNANIQEAAEKEAQAKEKCDECNGSLKEQEKAMKQLEKEHQKDLKEYKKLKEAADAARAEFGVYERKDVQLRENLKHTKSKTKKLDKTIASDTKSIGENESTVQRLQEDAVRFAEEIEKKQAELVTAEEVLTGIQEECKGEKAQLKKQLQTAHKELEPYTAAINEAKSGVDIAQQELDLLTSNARNIATQLKDAESNFAKATSMDNTRSTEINEMESRRTVAQKEFEKCQQDLEKITKVEPELSEKVSSKRAKVEEVRSTAGQARSQNKVLEALKATGRPGIYGRLGDLGAINQKYDCAVTTACGSLNNLVVDTIATGQWCIQYLKEHNIGRTTIICLDKQRHLEKKIAQNFSAPKGTNRLFDLITVKEPIIKTAFYYALRDTLCADSLDHATKVAYNGSVKYRVVTLEGQLIDTSGTMSGGGNRAARGGMSASLVEPMSPKEIAKMEKDLEKDVEILVTHRQEKKSLTASLASLKKELKSFDVKIQKCNMDITAAQKALPELKAVVQELTVKCAESQKGLKQQASLEAKLKKETAVFDKAKAAAAKYEATVAEVEEAIKAVGGVRLKAAKSKVKSLNSQVERQESSLTKSNVDFKTGKSKLTKLTKKIAKDTAESEKMKKQLTEIVAELEGMEQGAVEVMKSVEEAQTVLSERELSMAEINKSYKESEASVIKLRTAAVDMEEDLRAITATLKENQSKAKHWSSKINKLVLHKVGSDYLDDDSEDEDDAKDAEMDGGATKDGEDGASAETQSSKHLALRILDDEELAGLDDEEYEKEIIMMEERMGSKKPNVQAIKAYYEKEEQYIAKVGELDAVTQERDGIRANYEELRKQRLDMFFDGFKTISTKLKEMYQMITLGGDAELEYVDNINPFSEGIVFSVRPPRKSWKAIQNLSGGEKTLSSLALVFALHHFKPTPLYVMDEIDAALDFKNVSIVAHYIKERTKNAQFIIISLRNNMFELADRLVGIYKTDNCTKTVTINPKMIAAGNTAAPQSATAAAVKVHEAAVSTSGEPLAKINA